MKIISVAGATSKAGKTLLAEQIIRYCSRHYTPVTAVKFTTTSDLPTPCPRGAPCNVCDLSDRFRLIRDETILRQKGKNTERFYRANADHVVWVIARKSCLPIAYEHLLTHLTDNTLAVMEGSTVTSISDPHLRFYVFANHIPAVRWKESASEVMQQADFIIRNCKSNLPDSNRMQFPSRTISLNLADCEITNIPEVRSRIDAIIRELPGEGLPKFELE